jgi:hypothetical protein
MRSEKIAGWSCSRVQTYSSSTRSLCSIEHSNTLTEQHLEDINFVRAYHYQNNSRL